MTPSSPRTPTEKRHALRGMLAGDACLHPASIADPLGMRAAEDIGYEAVMLPGSLVSLAVLGAPDLTVLTLTELTEQVRRVCRAGDLPVVVDADHGYGNALNVRRTVEEVEAAGAAAATIEDTQLPAAFGGLAPSLVPLYESVGKMRAAADARIDKTFIVIGRTHATLSGGGRALLERQLAYQDAGVDAIFVSGLKSQEDLDALAHRARVPLILGAMPNGMSSQDLAARHVRLCLRGHQPNLQAVGELYRGLQTLRDGRDPPAIDTRALVRQLSRDGRYAQWMKRFMA